MVSPISLNDDADTCADDRYIDVCFDELDITYTFVSPNDKAEALDVDEIVENIDRPVTVAVSKRVSLDIDVRTVDGDLAGTDISVGFSASLFKLKICDDVSLLNRDVFPEVIVDIILLVSRLFVCSTKKVQENIMSK